MTTNNPLPITVTGWVKLFLAVGAAIAMLYGAFTYINNPNVAINLLKYQVDSQHEATTLKLEEAEKRDEDTEKHLDRIQDRLEDIQDTQRIILNRLNREGSSTVGTLE